MVAMGGASGDANTDAFLAGGASAGVSEGAEGEVGVLTGESWKTWGGMADISNLPGPVARDAFSAVMAAIRSSSSFFLDSSSF